MKYELRMPDLATNNAPVRIVRWIVRSGEDVARGQPLLEVETDKSTLEVESAVRGRLDQVLCEAGEEVSIGQPIAVLEIAETRPVAPAATGSVSRAPPAPPAAVLPAAELPVAAPPAGGGVIGRERRRATGEMMGELPPIPAERLAPYGRDQLLALYERMVLIREFEEGIKFLFLEGKMPGTIHQCQGQEATAVGVSSALREDDFITSTFRGHGHALAKGLSVQELLDELYGAKTGCCGGKGGSMHVGNLAKGMIPGIAIVGGGIPVAAGMGLAFKMRGDHRVVACFHGDGAVSEGAFHEGLNMAAIWSLPVLFACENNLYGASTHISMVMRDTDIARRVASYGIRSERVDGNDVLAVHAAARAAVDECRSGAGPVFLELLTYRCTGHSRRDACHYQPREEREAWAVRDPIGRLADALKRGGLADDAGLAAIRARIQREFHEAVERARSAPPPTVDDLTTDVLT